MKIRFAHAATMCRQDYARIVVQTDCNHFSNFLATRKHTSTSACGTKREGPSIPPMPGQKLIHTVFAHISPVYRVPDSGSISLENFMLLRLLEREVVIKDSDRPITPLICSLIEILRPQGRNQWSANVSFDSSNNGTNDFQPLLKCSNKLLNITRS